MAWLSPFQLGRPGFEISFDINPEAMTIDDTGIFVLQRNLAGDLKKSLIKMNAPTIKINSSYLTLAQKNAFSSLVQVTDSFLSFLTRDDWQVVDYKVTPSSLTTVTLPNTSSTRLSAVLVAAGFSSIITINSVLSAPSNATSLAYGDGGFGGGVYPGPDYYSGGGSYNDATRVITLNTALPTLDPVFVTYTYKGWLVDIPKFTTAYQAGWLDRGTYNIELTGA